MSIDEVEELNPHFRWNRRKQKSRVKHRAKKLGLNSFAIGCRGHAGIVTTKTLYRGDWTGSDVDIASLIDGVEGSCSIYHCAPTPISREYAMWLSRPENHEADKLLGWLKWFQSFDDFDQHYTREQFEDDKLGFREKIPKADGSALQKEIADCYEALMRGEKIPLPALPVSETTRYHRAIRPSDFATEAEVARLLELGEITSANKSFYEG